jgi:hypothetical protein
MDERVVAPATDVFVRDALDEVRRVDSTTSPDPLPTLPPGLPDEWVFDRDLPCPKCRYNLRMLRRPRCPECGTVFRWQALLYITCPRCGEPLGAVEDTQCPSCRLELDWTRLLQEVDPAQLKQFEYARTPARAAVRTWCGALRPRRFWVQLRLESPPVVNRLRWLRRAAIGFCMACIAIAFWSNRLFWPLALPEKEELAFCMAILLLPIATMIGLPFFTPTLTRFHIRRDQLLRCLAYGSTGLVWIGCAFLIAAVALVVVNTLKTYTWAVAGGASRLGRPAMLYPTLVFWLPSDPWMITRDRESILISGLLLGAALYVNVVWWWPFLWVALRHYLRLDHRNALALFVSTQLAGFVAVAIILVRYTALGPIIRSLLNQL